MAIRRLTRAVAMAVIPLILPGCLGPVARTPDQAEGSWTVVSGYDDAFVGATLDLRAEGSFSGENLPAVLVTGEEGPAADPSGTWELNDPITAGQPWSIGLSFDDETAGGRHTSSLHLEGPASDPTIRWWKDIDAGDFLLLRRD